MRILNIFFKNINSLEGEGRIYFDQGPIADSGVFAITGPNGSGKSSILDVITLGLYGETFRFDKPAAHVMTKQTRECFAKVEFALGDDKFRSSWEVKYNDSLPEVTPLLAKMTLTRINGQEETLAETPNQVRNRIAELTGMDFHKFSKSIMLPQGDFAAFLLALDSERMDILEKISGADLYNDYRQKTEQQLSQAQTRLSQLQQDIATLPLLNEQALETAAHDLQDFKEQVSEFKQQQRQVNQQLATLQNIDNLEHKQQHLQRLQQDLSAKIKHYQQDLQKIANNQAALQFRPEVNLLDAKQAQLEQDKATLESYRKELALLQQQLGSEANLAVLPLREKSLTEQKQVIDAIKLSVSEIKLELPRQRELAQSIQQQITQNQFSLSEVDNWLQAHANDASLVEDFPDVVRLRILRNERIELSRKQKSQASWAKNTQSALKKNRSSIESTQDDLNDLKQKIDADEKTLRSIAQGKNFDELKELQKEQQIRVADFQELISLATVTSKLTNKGLFSWLGISKQSNLPPNAIKLQTDLDELQQEMNREENIIKVLEQALRNEALIKKMGADRAKLLDGQPCYLCGSITHPYVLKPPVFTDAKKALVDQRGKIQALKSHIDSVNTQLKAAQSHGSKMSARQQRLQQIQSEWTVLANRLNIMRDGMDIDNLSLQNQKQSEEATELDKINNLVKQHAQLQRDIAKMKTDIETKQAALERFNKSVQELESAWSNRPADFDDIEQRYNTCINDETALIAKLENQLTALGEKLPAKGKENTLFDRLNGRRQDYQVYILRQQGLQKDIAALTEKLRNCENNISSYQQQLASSAEALTQQERLSLHIAIIEKQKLIIDQEQQIRITQIEYRTILQTLTESITGLPFESVDELINLIHLIAQESNIKQQMDIDTAGLERTDQQLQPIMATLAEQRAATSNLSLADIQPVLNQIAEKIDIAEQEVLSLENKLAKQQQYQDKFKTLQAQADEQQRLFAEADAEIQLINDDPASFKRQMQQVMIDKLLSQTNQILEKLSGRYYVRSGASDLGLALEIEDTKQKNVRRLPQTLSGGESFVVSLALALGLSEIANNGKAIDSLFLDEGFGNLDADSLYLAMSTLESLKTHGKTVGIISHVDAVKKRIKTQIELVKKPNGLSELKMVA